MEEVPSQRDLEPQSQSTSCAPTLTPNSRRKSSLFDTLATAVQNVTSSSGTSKPGNILRRHRTQHDGATGKRTGMFGRERFSVIQDESLNSANSNHSSVGGGNGVSPQTTPKTKRSSSLHPMTSVHYEVDESSHTVIEEPPLSPSPSSIFNGQGHQPLDSQSLCSFTRFATTATSSSSSGGGSQAPGIDEMNNLFHSPQMPKQKKFQHRLSVGDKSGGQGKGDGGSGMVADLFAGVKKRDNMGRSKSFQNRPSLIGTALGMFALPKNPSFNDAPKTPTGLTPVNSSWVSPVSSLPTTPTSLKDMDQGPPLTLKERREMLKYQEGLHARIEAELFKEREFHSKLKAMLSAVDKPEQQIEIGRQLAQCNAKIAECTIDKDLAESIILILKRQIARIEEELGITSLNRMGSEDSTSIAGSVSVAGGVSLASGHLGGLGEMGSFDVIVFGGGSGGAIGVVGNSRKESGSVESCEEGKKKTSEEVSNVSVSGVSVCAEAVIGNDILGMAMGERHVEAIQKVIAIGDD
eukprot:comp23729_c0_seq2/m.40916 comp23729_c0_seq2/g.40916  ORF comp23729_c0_seq2/g.40916 comp23729_c0_seq2/m.40916 type:complete len:522 (-) comp23729_c0_seq2:170-1735(-)